MPSVKLSPLFNDAQLDNNGLPLSGGFVYWYIASTSTPVIVYTESTGTTPNTNPVVLNTRGEPVQPIWLPSGQSYKAVLTDGNGALIRTIDNISGVNDTSLPTLSEWVVYGQPATYVSTTQFSVTGDQRIIFTNDRRIKTTVSGADVYGTISGTPTYALGVTTITLVLDSGVLDNSLSVVYYGLLNPEHPSIDITQVNSNTQSALQAQTYTAFTSAGSAGVFTLTPVPAITSYVAGQRFSVTFNAASSATNTINVNGLGVKALKMYNAAGVKMDAAFASNQISDVVYDGTDFVLLDGKVASTGTGSFVLANAPTLTGVPLAPTATAGTNTTQIATTANVYGSSLGWGQTWQNMTSSSRSAATTYYNATGKPIMVIISFPDAATTSGAVVNVGGVTLIDMIYDIGSSSATLTASFIVPSGDSYLANVSGAGTIGKWVELR